MPDDTTATPTYAPSVAAVLDSAQGLPTPDLRSQYTGDEQSVDNGKLFGKLDWKLVALAASGLCLILATALYMSLKSNRVHLVI